jgi:hypothetical protein
MMRVAVLFRVGVGVAVLVGAGTSACGGPATRGADGEVATLASDVGAEVAGGIEVEAPTDSVVAPETPGVLEVTEETAETAEVTEVTEETAAGACATTSAIGLAACADAARYDADMAFVAAPRSPGIAHWQAVQDRCATVFAAAGFTVERHAYATGVNVIGVLPGLGAGAEQVIVSAHYDSVRDCPGADDNGSGTAAVLEAARVLGRTSYDKTLVVACWDEEERGLIGSRAWVERAVARGEKVAVAFVFEMLGFTSSEPGSQVLPAGFELLFPDQIAAVEANGRRGDFIAVVGDELARAAMARVKAHATTAGLPTVVLELAAGLKTNALIGDLRRSDHAPFWFADYPAMMLTDTANFRNPHYHCLGGEDTVATLDLGFALKSVRAVIGAAADTAGVRP